jgi:hypothetical protein
MAQKYGAQSSITADFLAGAVVEKPGNSREGARLK